MKKTPTPDDRPEKIDTTADIKVKGFSEVSTDSQARFVRILFKDLGDKDVPLLMPLSLAEHLLPLLSRNVLQARGRAGKAGERMPFEIRKGSIFADADGAIIFDFVLTNGVRFPVSLDRPSATLFLSALTELLGMTTPSGPPPGKPDPRKAN